MFNLNTSYGLTDDVTIRFGVDNLFNKAPEFGNVSTTANPAFFGLPGGGRNINNNDTLGRRFYLGANLRF